MTERQQVLYLWLDGSGLDARTVGWAFYDGTDDAAAGVPDDEPPYASGVGALQDGWMLIQSSQLLAPVPGREHVNSHLEHEFVFERRIAI